MSRFCTFLQGLSLILILGTAGASDCGNLALSQCVLLLLSSAALFLLASHWKSSVSSRRRRMRRTHG